MAIQVLKILSCMGERSLLARRMCVLHKCTRKRFAWEKEAFACEKNVSCTSVIGRGLLGRKKLCLQEECVS